MPMRDARTAALRDLVIQAPALVVANALGFHQTTTTRQLSPERAQDMTPMPASNGQSLEESQ